MSKSCYALIAALSMLAPGLALADAGADGMYNVGKKGDKADASRTVNISMRETDDGKMAFEPRVLQFREGETVVLNFTNKGEVDHEFFMDTEEKVKEHKAVMEKNPEMEHADDNTIRLKPGEEGQIVWTFAKGGSFSFACMIPGHYDAGMHGKLKVN